MSAEWYWGFAVGVLTGALIVFVMNLINDE